MPSRNTIRIDLDESYYHVYFRGINKQSIFQDEDDRVVFFSILKRYLGNKKDYRDDLGRYESYYDRLELLAYCLMTNHVHMLLYQVTAGSMGHFMRSVLNSYTRHYNTKYNRRGPLMESRYKASLIQTDSYLLHISRYIHMNPRLWQTHPYSSLYSYLGASGASWLRPGRIIELFEGSSYMEFMKDYEDSKKMLEEIKYDLADK